MTSSPLSRTEFWGLCRQHGFLGADSTNFSYLCIDGVNRVEGSNGRLKVPLESNAEFLRMCARAIEGGTTLCLHAQRTDPLSPLFFDLDWKPFADPAHSIEVVCQQFYKLMQVVFMPEGAQLWVDHIGMPSEIVQRFPHLKDARDVFQALNANPHSPMTGGDTTLIDMFKTADFPACQNWLNRNIAVALAVVAQSVVRLYFREREERDDVFSCFAFYNHTDEPSDCKLGAHLHFNLVLYATSAQDISRGLANKLERDYGLGAIVDPAVHTSGLRMPFNAKPQLSTSQIKKQRLRDVEGHVVVIRRYYKPAAFVDAVNSAPDVSSVIGTQFLRSVLTALRAASVRTTAAAPTPGFDNTGLVCAPPPPAKQETGKEYFDRLELTAPRRAMVNRLVMAEPNVAKRDALYGQWAKYLEALGPEGISKSVIALPIPLTEPAGQCACETFPDMFKLAFCGAFNDTEITGLVYWPTGTKSNNKHQALLVFTNSTKCYNRSSAGGTPVAHSGDRAHSWFMLDNVDMSITQRCNNAQPHGLGHQRASKTSCKEWRGYTVRIANMAGAEGGRVKALFEKIFALLAGMTSADVLAGA